MYHQVLTGILTKLIFRNKDQNFFQKNEVQCDVPANFSEITKLSCLNRFTVISAYRRKMS